MLVILRLQHKPYILHEGFEKSHAISEKANLAIISQTNDIFIPFFC